MKTILFRMAEPEDAQGILSIYSPYIKETAVTFEYTVPSVGEFRDRMEAVRKAYPYLICEVDGHMAGYAYAHRYRERAAYQWDAELSVYLEPKFTGRGIGRAFYQALEEILKLQNVQNLYGLVASPNPSSEALHISCGFRLLGREVETGYKLGKWIDISYFGKSIGDKTVPPKPLLGISCVEEGKIQEILDNTARQVQQQFSLSPSG